MSSYKKNTMRIAYEFESKIRLISSGKKTISRTEINDLEGSGIAQKLLNHRILTIVKKQKFKIN